MEPYVIAISAVGGGGKTAVSTLLQKSLQSSVLFSFDDFDDTNVYPEDYYEWSLRGGNLLEFDCPGLAEAVRREVQKGEVPYIVLDYPFGRDHPRLRDLIDLSVFIDTPLDVALARRILRDYPGTSGPGKGQLRKDLAYYLEKARYPFLDMDKRKETSDLVLDGWRSLEDIRDQILERIRLELIKRRTH
jgi:hypothetical protein